MKRERPAPRAQGEAERFEAFLRHCAALPEVRLIDAYVQHGDTSCLLHSVAVAHYSYRVARRLRLRVRPRDLARGALLHDYFLYDWHRGGVAGRPHAFAHPAIALENARRAFQLSEVEKNIIARHMFPLTPVPPACVEGWLVTLVDKALSVYEAFARDAYRDVKRRYLKEMGEGAIR